ncbi:MAG: sporulation transcriptional regulator SpoIIID [Clostridia bacterium]|nr:stage III sporulation protein D [Oscillospiraceae bacterium]MBQ7005407.1 sporulation transcriptional regulator SpoIIID [Clostridia bacterium]
MENNADERAVILGRYIVKHNATVRSTAKANSVSKSTVHSDVAVKLKKIDGDLYEKVRAVLDKNKRERHLRGGIATKEKYSRSR